MRDVWGVFMSSSSACTISTPFFFQSITKASPEDLINRRLCGAAVLADPPTSAAVRPGPAIIVALGIQDLRTRVFRGVELEDHPLRIWNARIRCRVQESEFVGQEPEVYRTDVIFQLLGLPGSYDHAADRRSSQHPRERHTGKSGVMPTGNFLQRFYDAVAHLLVKGHEIARFGEACARRSRVGAAVLAREKHAGKWAPGQDTDVVILGVRLELHFAQDIHAGCATPVEILAHREADFGGEDNLFPHALQSITNKSLALP